MEALYRKYRPSTFEDVSGQEHVKTVLLNQIAAGQTAHAYLLTGPRGVGKTTVARLIAKAVNCLKSKNGEPCNACEACLDIQSGASLDVQEIDAASQTKVEETRENIIESHHRRSNLPNNGYRELSRILFAIQITDNPRNIILIFTIREEFTGFDIEVPFGEILEMCRHLLLRTLT
ncbi:AAA family ATPase [bacterium]|nr:AAA family ATPase [bacterium]